MTGLQHFKADAGEFLEPELLDALSDDFNRALADEPWCNTKQSGGEGETDTFFGLKTKRLHGLACTVLSGFRQRSSRCC